MIGVAADGISPLGNGTTGGFANRNGIRVEGTDNLIGGTQPGEGNTIAFHGGSGVLLPLTFVLPNSGWRNSVLGNAIHSNSGLGIDIYGGGVTTNDLNDVDGGPNDVQNFPVLGSALTFGTNTTIQGTLNSIANSVFRVEFFSSATADGTTNRATTADNDYSAVINQMLTFIPNGPLTQTVTVNVVGDSKFERNETFFVNLSGPTGATLADGQGLGTIQNDDLAPTHSFSTTNSVLEGNVTADDRKVPFTVTLSAVSGVDVAGTISTTSGTVIEDTTFEPDEQFSIDATASDPTTVNNSGGTASGTGTIQNDDSASTPPVSIGPGCCGSALIINGSNANDTIRVVPQGQDAVKVLINGQSYGPFAGSSFQEIIVYGNNGNDDIELAGTICTPAFLFGEAGNDRLKGGNGANVLVGGNGNDELIGSQAADVLIGDDGSDRLVGNGGDDLLIAGWTNHDTSLAALCAILDEWSRCDASYSSRVNNLRVGGGRNGSVRLNCQTVHDDGDCDRLTGSAGRDWFFANTNCGFLDHITDRHSTELVDDID